MIANTGDLLDCTTEKRRTVFSSPTRTIALSFAAVILIGTFLLMLPISSRINEYTPFMDSLFTATSATCVTGLVVYDTFTHWSIFGQCVIIALIQIGGLGLVSFTTFFNILIGKKLGLRGRHLALESVSSMGTDVKQIISMVFKVSLIVELVGALLLMIVFIPQYGIPRGIYVAVFLSVSAFCNAGFDILGDQGMFVSLSNYNDNPLVLGVIGMLIIIGGIGFIVVYDLTEYRKTKQLTLHTRVVLCVTAVLILVGMIFTLAFEWENPATLGALPTAQRFGAALFHSVSCRTAGFNSIPLDKLQNVTKILSSILMFFGAAPGSTGGGIKCTTVAVLFMTVYCVITGHEDTVIFHRKVGKEAVYKSLAVMILGVMAVTITAGCIVATMHETHNVTGVDALFESVSAFATVGLSAGISEIANLPSKLLLIFSMYIGRLEPVTFFLSLAMRPSINRKEILPMGKIQIG